MLMRTNRPVRVHRYLPRLDKLGVPLAIGPRPTVSRYRRLRRLVKVGRDTGKVSVLPRACVHEGNLVVLVRLALD